MSAHKEQNAIRKSVSTRRWLLSTALTAVSVAAMAVPAEAQVADSGPWTDWSNKQGSFSHLSDGTNTTIQSTSDRAGGDSRDLNIDPNERVEVLQPSNHSLFFGRAIDGTDPTLIRGSLTSNGRILIIDSNGVFFGDTSTVDVAGLITTSGSIDNGQLMNNAFGDYVIENVGSGGAIELNGTINVAEAGLAAFVSPFITNNGVINAKLGKVTMASGDKVTLDLYGDGLFEVAVEGELSDALIENNGAIIAEGGRVQVTALAAKDAVDNIINMEGIVDVSSVTQEGGKIVLSGGDKGKVSVSGTLGAAGATDGGEISVTGQSVEVAATGQLDASGVAGNGGDIEVIGADAAYFHGNAMATGGTDGGFVEVSAPHVMIDGTFKVGNGGELLIDPVDLCVFGSGGTCGSVSSVDFITSLRPVLIGGGTVTTEVNSATGDDGDVTIVGNLSAGGFATTSRGTWNIIANDDITFGDMPGGDTGTIQTANLVVTGEGLDMNITSNEGGSGGSEWAFTWLTDNSVLNTGGGNFTSNAGNFTVESGAVLDAAGGNIDINNSTGVFESADANSIRTSGAGTIDIDQNVDGRNGSTTGSIQNVIDAIDATGWGHKTVHVGAGTYTENLTVDKKLRVSGELGATLQYDTVTGTGNLITVTSRSIIDGFTFDGLGVASNGIHSDGAEILKVYDNTFQGFVDTNVNVNNGEGIMIFDNVMTGANTGILADNAYDIKINDNIITDAGEVGVHVKNSDGPDYRYDIDIWGNTISSSNGTTTGVLVENSDYATVGLEQNPYASGYPGGNKISGGGNAIVIKDSDHTMTRYNTITDVAGTGVTLTNSDDATIRQNMITAKTTGINVSSSDDLEIYENIISSTMGPNGPVLGDGIFVKNSKRMNVHDNTITNIGDDGIQGNNTDGATVANNTIENVGDAGIALISGSSNVAVTGNTITNASGGFGIRTSGGGSVTITGNNLTNTGSASRAFQNDAIHVDGNYSTGLVDSNIINTAANAGIEIEDVDSGLTVSNNEISNAGIGIYNNGSNGTNITGNVISNVVDGILVNPSAGVMVSGNTVTNASEDGIDIKDSQDVTVTLNTVDGTANGSRNDGISVENSKNVVVRENTVRNSGWDGIYAGGSTGTQIVGNDVSNSDQVDITVLNGSVGTLVENNVTYNSQRGILVKTGSQDTTVRGNVVYNQTLDGIHVRGDKSVEVVGNYVGYTDKVGTVGAPNNIASDGIFLIDADGALVTGNQITEAGGNGIYNNSSDNTVLSGNTITNVDGSGILVNPSNDVVISGNTITNPGDNGITLENSSRFLVSNNTISDVYNIGVEVDGGEDGQILRNTITDAWRGIDAFENDGILIARNTIGDIRNTGIYVDFDYFDQAHKVVKIVGNDVYNTVSDGILIDDAPNAEVRNNDVDNAGRYGIAAYDTFGNGGYKITGNDVDGAMTGIYVDDSDGALVARNEVDRVSNNGIEISSSDNALVRRNSIHFAGGDGIYVTESNGAKVRRNHVHYIKDDGVDVRDSDGVVVARNNIRSTGGDGVQVRDSDYAKIRHNDVHNTGDDGIDVENSDYAVIARNHVGDTDENGIEVSNSENVKIRRNYVHNAGDNGIDVESSFNADVIANSVRYSRGDGIELSNSSYADIRRNYVYRSGDDGIDVDRAYKVDVVNNHVHGTRWGNGIEVTNSYDADVLRNDVHYTGEDGIYVDNSRYADIRGNDVHDTGDDGIDVRRSYKVDVVNNETEDTNGDGIQVRHSDGADIKRNEVHDAGDDGIDVENSDYADIERNHVGDTDENGIEVTDSRHVDVNRNLVHHAGDNGILIERSFNADVNGNNVRYSRGDGIELSNSSYADIRRNYVYRSGDDGIDVDRAYKVDVVNNHVHGTRWGNGIEVTNSYDADVLRNDVHYTGRDGIYVENARYADIRGNAVHSTGDDGIDVRSSYKVDVVNNETEDTNGDGIQVRYSRGADIKRNVVHGAGDDGIDVENSDNTVIARNHVGGTDVNGIEVSDSDNVKIRGNLVHHAGDNGIFVEDGHETMILRNRVGFADGNGIQVEDSDRTVIGLNRVRRSGDDGIDVEGGRDVLIVGNKTVGNGDDGIDVDDNSGRVYIYGNAALRNRDNGIDVSGAPHVEIRGNTAARNGENGIYARHISAPRTLIIDGNTTRGNREDGIKASYFNTAYITNNTSFNNGDDGIDVHGGYHVEIRDNNVYRNGFLKKGPPQKKSPMPQAKGGYPGDDYGNGNGIEVSDIYGDNTVIIDGNTVHNNRVDGVNVQESDRVIITDNEIFSNGDDGVDVNYAHHVEIRDNNIYRNGYGFYGYPMPGIAKGVYLGDDGYEGQRPPPYLYGEGHGVEVSNVYGAYTLIVDDNNIHNNAVDGVNVNDVNRVLITDNNIYSNGDDGVDINWAYHVEIDDNNIYNNGWGRPPMPYPYPSASVKVSYDDGYDYPPHYEYDGGNGIEVTNIYGGETLIIDDNNIYANRTNGIEVRNSDSSYILDNNIYENGEHGLAMLGWNNGDVVLEGNTFTDNPIGALFESGYIDISNLQEPNTFTNTNPSATPVGMVFDNGEQIFETARMAKGPIRGQLSIVGNTLGATTFTGFQNQGSFYVRIEDGTLLDGAGAPIVIDGLNAMFDGIRPSSTGGVLSSAQLNFIEDRLYDADDSPVNGRGQIFVGVEQTGLDNIEDFFNEFFGFNPGPGRLNVTIAGMPSVGAGAPNPAAALNLIAPAAGGSENPEDVAGELANIEPAAGNENAPCWGDAINAASNGATVNYSFGGSFEEALADASACSVTGL